MPHMPNTKICFTSLSFFVFSHTFIAQASVKSIEPQIQDFSREDIYGKTCTKDFTLDLDKNTQLKCLLSEPCNGGLKENAQPVWFLQGLAGVGKAYEHWLRYFAKRGNPTFTCDIPGVDYPAYKPFREAWYSFGSSSLALWWMIKTGEDRFLEGFKILNKIVPLLDKKVYTLFSKPVNSIENGLILAGHSLGSIYSLGFAGVLTHKGYEKASFPVKSMVLLSPPEHDSFGFTSEAFKHVSDPAIFISGSEDDPEDRLEGFFEISSDKAMLASFKDVHHLSFSVNPRKEMSWNPHIGKIMGVVEFFLNESNEFKEKKEINFNETSFNETIFAIK